MIHIVFDQTTNGNIHGFTMDGHANFADKGQDIVCAGVSAVAFGSVNAVIALTGIEMDIEQSESGFLKCSLPNSLPSELAQQAQLLLKAMLVSLQTIEEQYSEFVQIIFNTVGGGTDA